MPLDDPVVIVTTKMDRIVEVDVDERVAWVEPGVLNLDLTKAVARHGLHFAPDPSSQQSCSIGGNVATNSGGPHCLASGVTSTHVLAVEVVLPDGEVVVLGGVDPEPEGFDLRGAFVGGEGTLGIATEITVRLTPNPPTVRTMLLDFADVDDGAATVSAVIAAGIVPAAIEMMDALITRAVEAFVHAGFPTDAAAILIVEVDGLEAGVEDAVKRVTEIGLAHGARSVRVATDEAERALIWKGRKNAFGAIARIKPNYYLHDTVVPRRRLVEVLREVYAIAARHDLLVMNVFHAGDGNLHPLLVFDKREPGVMERVLAAGEEIVRASVAAGGVLSGEHGIGIEKRDYMPLHVLRGRPRRPGPAPPGLRSRRRRQPAQGAARGQPVRRAAARAGRRVDLTAFAEEVGAAGPVTCVGGRTQWDVGGAVLAEAREVRAPAGVEAVEPEEMIVRCGAGTPVTELQAALAERGSDGGAPGVAGCDRGRRAGRGPQRHPAARTGPGARRAPAGRRGHRDGDVVKAGGPTVKNVSGFDLCRLLVGSLGTLGVPRRGDPAHPAPARGAAVAGRRRRPLRRPAPPLPTGVDPLGRRHDVGVPRGPPGRRPGPGVAGARAPRGRRSAGAPVGRAAVAATR